MRGDIIEKLGMFMLSTIVNTIRRRNIRPLCVNV